MIDAHVHFWDPARGDDILILRREPSLARRSMPSDLLPVMAAAGVTAAVAIQSAPDPRETDDLLAVCKPVGEVRAVVGWIDLAAPDADRAIEALARRPKVTGVRAMLNRIDAPDWLSSARVHPGLAALAKAGLTLDLIARADHVPSIIAVADALPHLAIVVDHGATAPIRHGDIDAWSAAVARLGAETRTLTKFSGLAEEAAPDWSVDRLEPAFRHLLASFGPERIMWASNWPVIDLRGGYARWVSASCELLDRAGLNRQERLMIEEETARRFYRGLD
jgi:L-fuconolactonase